ncbi:DUF262 domain-containing protein [Streptomyces sp. HMX112]|uniref:GmrSD restriction endonuclease domain-containing protein n=1 Tax=Streptomyces sp. HMX112 TaxID=3390850 RepID=UPI003A800187
MQAKETLFADLVQGRTQQFQVPLYQRTYSWTERQLGQVWADILEQASCWSPGTVRAPTSWAPSCSHHPRRTR